MSKDGQEILITGETEFIHLHCHSMASVLDGFSTPEEIILRAKALGQKAIAITDHGSMAGIWQFQKAAREHGIKPLFGMEAYFAEDATRREKDDYIYHMGLIARNQRGLEKLFKLSDYAWNVGFYKKPRIDWAAFDAVCDKHDEDIILLTGCMDGVLSRHIRDGNMAKMLRFKEQIQERFSHIFVEIQTWNEPSLNTALLSIAETNQLPVVVTGDTHYGSLEERTAEEVNLAIQQSAGKKISEKRFLEENFEQSRRIGDPLERLNFLHPNRKLRFDRIDNYITPVEVVYERMKAAGLGNRMDAIANTVEVANLCELELEEYTDLFPKFSNRLNSNEYLRQLAYDKLVDLHLDSDKRYAERLEEELDVVCRLGFSDYMLVIWDMMNWAKMKKIRTGPGRGSVAGSLLAFCLSVTQVDPIKHNLLFWRFLNLEVIYDVEFEEING